MEKEIKEYKAKLNEITKQINDYDTLVRIDRFMQEIQIKRDMFFTCEATVEERTTKKWWNDHIIRHDLDYERDIISHYVKHNNNLRILKCIYIYITALNIGIDPTVMYGRWQGIN